MARTNIGVLSSGYEVGKTDWTALTVSNSAGHYLYGQTSRAMINDIKYIDGKMFVIVSDQDFTPNPDYAIWYNSNPFTNTTGWLGLNPDGGTGSNYGSMIGYNPTQGKWYFGKSHLLSVASTLTGTRTHYYDGVTREGYYGYEYSPIAIDHNGTRSIIALNSGPGACGTLMRTDNGSTFTQPTGVGWYVRKQWDIKYLGNNIWISGAAGKVCFRSTDNGASFSAFFIDPANQGNEIREFAHNGSGLVIAKGDYRLYKSTDYGATWTQVFIHSPQSAIFNMYNAPGNGYINGAPDSIVWSADDNCFIYMTANGYQYYSDSTGTTWTQNTKFTTSILGSGIVGSVLAYDTVNKKYLAVATKTTTDQYNTTLSKALAWTDNIKGT